MNSCGNHLLLPIVRMESELTAIVEATLDDGLIAEAIDGIIARLSCTPIETKTAARYEFSGLVRLESILMGLLPRTGEAILMSHPGGGAAGSPA